MKIVTLLCCSLCYWGALWPFSAGAAPSNDYFTNSIHLEGTNVTTTADLTGANREPGEPQHPSYGAMTGESAWWSWVTPESGRADIIGIDSWSVGWGIYTGPDIAHLQRVYFGWYGSFTAEAGTVYHIALERRVNGNPVVNFTVKVTPYATNSPNDNFADAAPLGFRAANLAATREPGEPAHRAGGPNKSLWWRWTVPFNSSAWVGGQTGTLPDVAVVAYTGVSVESLTPVARGVATNAFYFNATGGVTYYIAAETAADAYGEIQLDGGAVTPDGRVVNVPGNLVQNSSFETLSGGMPLASWTAEGSFSGYISTPGHSEGAADGGNYVAFGWGSQIGQTLTTVEGLSYQVKLAIYRGGVIITNPVVVLFGGQPSSEYVLPQSPPAWQWVEFTFTATNSQTLLQVRSMGDPVGIDKVTCVPMNQPPQIVLQPRGVSSFPGGAVTFVAGATGSEPLRKQWLFNGAPLTGENASVLNIANVETNHVGSYQFWVTNAYGSVTSAPAWLILEVPTSPAIVLQPESQSALPGEYVCLVVAAVGTPPLQYQWFKDGQSLLPETNRHLVIRQFDAANCGTYTVEVFNDAESVASLPAVLSLAPAATGGGQVYFANRRFILEAPADAPVFDTDGVTPLSGPTFKARLYIGSTSESLRAAAEPLPFLSGFSAGFFDMNLLTLPQIPPGTQVYAQVRAWDATQGASFEEVRAMGGRLGASAVLPIVTAGGTWPAPTDGFLIGLQSFSLQYGLPEYRRGLLRFVTQGSDGVLTWELIGQPGGRYIIERQADGANWQPLLTLANPGGRITFTDTPPANAVSTLYRAQLLQ